MKMDKNIYRYYMNILVFVDLDKIKNKYIQIRELLSKGYRENCF